MPSAINQRKRNTVWSQLYVESIKTKQAKQDLNRPREQIQRTKGGLPEERKVRGWVKCMKGTKRTVVLEKTLESPLDCNEIQPVHPKGDQSWVFIGKTDVAAETPILWQPDAKSWLIWKDPDAGRDWGQEEKGTTEDEMAGWHHRLDGREFEWTPGVGDRQGGLACCNSWGHKELDMNEWLNWTGLHFHKSIIC